jgi:type II secretory pathway pseudopilin PulG
MRGLIVLAAGGRQAARADIPSFMQQRLETGSFWSAVVELGSTHPFLCKRVAALQEVSQPGTVAPVGRNPLAYPLAPFLAFGSMAGGGASLLVVVAMIGIIAAIAIPSLLRARMSANESAALGDVRAVAAAESAYARAANAYGPMPCLVAPGPCVVGFQGTPFLPEALAAEVKGGYRRALRVGPAGQSFVFVATPVTPGQTGLRSFCTDSEQTLCASTEPEFERASVSACDRSRCRPLGP